MQPAPQRVKFCGHCKYSGTDGHWKRDCPQNPSNQLKVKLEAAVDEGKLIQLVAHSLGWPQGGARIELVGNGSVSIASDVGLRDLLQKSDFCFCRSKHGRDPLGGAYV